MSNNKQPLEGLTVRIWDVDNKDDKKKGSEGFREYTEQIGSSDLKYTVHKWDKEEKKQDIKQGLKKSTRDWAAEDKKLNQVQELSLVSRSDHNDSKQSLKTVALQYELWSLILSKVSVIQDDFDKKQWDPMVDLLRKLREGVYASHWSEGNYEFAIQVFQLSIDCAIKAGRYEELAKALAGLIENLYVVSKQPVSPYYVVLDIIYHCCYLQHVKKANHRISLLALDTNEGKFGKSLIKSIMNQNPIRYFEHYHYNPYPAFKILMRHYNDTMRILAIEMLCKAYMSTSIAWVGKWIGIYHDNGQVLNEMEKLVQPSCIKSVDYDRQIVYLIKKSKR